LHWPTSGDVSVVLNGRVGIHDGIPNMNTHGNTPDFHDKNILTSNILIFTPMIPNIDNNLHRNHHIITTQACVRVFVDSTMDT